MFRHPASVIFHLPDFWARQVLRYKYVGCWNAFPINSTALFVHVPKCGGTTLAEALYGHQINHFSAKVLALSDQERFRNSFSFAILRDPVERFLSAIRHCVSGPRASEADRRIGMELGHLGTEPLEIAEELSKLSRLKFYRLCGRLTVFVPQYHWVSNGTQILVNQVYGLRSGRRFDRLGSLNMSKDDVEKGYGVDRRVSDWIRSMYQRDVTLYERFCEEEMFDDARDVLDVLASHSQDDDEQGRAPRRVCSAETSVGHCS
jgi:hypothetical protein